MREIKRLIRAVIRQPVFPAEGGLVSFLSGRSLASAVKTIAAANDDLISTVKFASDVWAGSLKPVIMALIESVLRVVWPDLFNKASTKLSFYFAASFSSSSFSSFS